MMRHNWHSFVVIFYAMEHKLVPVIMFSYIIAAIHIYSFKCLTYFHLSWLEGHRHVTENLQSATSSVLKIAPR